MSFELPLRGTRVLMTGHTGFTGSWATLWLASIGAEVHGVALPPPTTPSLFVDAQVEASLASHRIVDVGDSEAVDVAMAAIAPDVVLHLAAQPLVRHSYADPVETYRTNVMGTANVLESARRVGVRGVVCITTDKVYANREWMYGYRENDRLGGADPYSASKAAAELVIDSYRQSMTSWSQTMAIAAARGGNIIGGGDWANDRLIPDFARSVLTRRPVVLRNPHAIRPWQHVLCLVHGYLTLLSGIMRDDPACSSAFNLGPTSGDTLTVAQVVERLQARWSDLKVEIEPSRLHETSHLALDSTKAQQVLGWRPAWSTEESVDRTGDWYAAYAHNPATAATFTREQIEAYRSAVS